MVEPNNGYDLNSNDNAIEKLYASAISMENTANSRISIIYQNQFTDIVWANIDPSGRFIWLIKWSFLWYLIEMVSFLL